MITNAYPDLDLDSAEYIVRPAQLNRLAQLLSTYQPRDMANVLGWRALFQLLPHMGSNFRGLLFKYHRQRHLIESQSPRFVQKIYNYLKNDVFSLVATYKAETTVFSDQNPLTKQFYLLLAE